ncbi:MAG: VTT domain-containing protein [Rhodospirillales bacterium]
MSLKLVLRGGTLLLSLIGVVILIRATGLDAHLDETWIDTYVRGKGVLGVLIFVVAGGLVTGIGLPRQLIAFLGGYAFGIVEGTALAVLATVVGCIFTFYYARFMGRSLIAGRFPGKVKRIDGFLAENPFSMTLLIRFLPFGSNLLTNLAAGVSSVPGLPYFAGSAIGYVPQTLIFALIGTGIKVDPAANIALAAGLFALSGILGVYLYRRHRHGKILDDDLDAEFDDANPKTAD